MRVGQRVALAAILLAAFALRIFRLDAQGLWTDEAWSHWITSLGPRGILDYSLQPFQHPPVYYYLLAGWMGFAGDSEFSMRFLSLCFSMLCVALVFWFARRRLPPGVAAWAMVLAALSPFLIVYAQEARMYIVVLCVSILALEFLLRWLEDGRRSMALPFFALTLLGFSIHYYTALLFLVEQLYILLIAWRRFPRARAGVLADVRRFANLGAWFRQILVPWASGTLAVVSAVSGWVLLSAGPRAAVAQQISHPLFEGRNLEELQRNLVFLVFGGIVYRPLSFAELATTAFLLAAAALGAVHWWRSRPSNSRLALLCLLVIVPPLAASPVPDNYNARYFFMSVPALIWLSAAALSALRARGRLVFGAALLALLAANGYGVWFNYAFVKNAYRDMARVVTQGARADDALLFDGPHQEFLSAYYLRGPWARVEVPTDPAAAELSDVDAALRAVQQAHPRLWIVAQQSSAVDPGDNVARWLSLNAYPVTRSWFQYDDFVALFLAGPANVLGPRQVRFGDLLMLEQASASGGAARPGDGVAVHLTWHALRKVAPPDRFLVTLRLYDAQGLVVQERVTPPCGGYCPVDNWVPGESVEDRHGLLLPTGLNPGAYSLRLSVYQPRRAQSLPAFDQQGAAGDSVELLRLTLP